MARGESEAAGGGHAGMVIGVIFAVACLASLLAVVTAHRQAEEPQTAVASPAPFVGAYGLLTGLRWRDCAEGVPPPPLEVSLRARGYEALGSPRPATEREVPAGFGEGCGVVLLRGPGLLPDVSCAQSAVAQPACGDAPLTLSGQAEGRTALAFALAGVTEDGPLMLDERLAHAEAAHLLSGAGYVAGELAGEAQVPGSGEVTLPLPPPPTTGCLALVVSVLGSFDDVVVEHGGAIRSRSPPAGHGPQRRALVGLPHCAGPAGRGALRATNVDAGTPLRVVYRPLTPPAGPGARGRQTRLRRVDPDLAAVVASVPSRPAR